MPSAPEGSVSAEVVVEPKTGRALVVLKVEDGKGHFLTLVFPHAVAMQLSEDILLAACEAAEKDAVSRQGKVCGQSLPSVEPRVRCERPEGHSKETNHLGQGRAWDKHGREVCSRCGSPDPARHPAWQFEGEVEICPDAFHGRH